MPWRTSWASWCLGNPAPYTKATCFQTAVTEQTINALLTHERHLFDGEACRYLWTFADGMQYDGRTGRIAPAHRSTLNTRHCPWPYVHKDVPGFKEIGEDLWRILNLLQ